MGDLADTLLDEDSGHRAADGTQTNNTYGFGTIFKTKDAGTDTEKGKQGDTDAEAEAEADADEDEDDDEFVLPESVPMPTLDELLELQR